MLERFLERTYILTATQPVNAGTFRAALQKTEENRGTVEQMADAAGAIQMIAESPILFDSDTP